MSKVRKIAFIGFEGEAMTLEIENDSEGKHDHIWIVSSKGKRQYYLHIDETAMSAHTYPESKCFYWGFEDDYLSRLGSEPIKKPKR